MKKVVIKDTEVKCNITTSVEILTETEIDLLRRLKPLSYKNRGATYGPTAVTLHWKITERDVDENLRKLKEDPEYEVPFPISRLRFFISHPQVPSNVREKAKILMHTYEGAVVRIIERKYSTKTQVTEITESEKTILDKLRIIDRNYGPVVTSLLWKVNYENLCKNIQDYQQGNLQANDGLMKHIDFLASNPNVPTDVSEKAKEVQKLLPRRHKFSLV